MPIAFHRVYLESAGYFMPGEPVSTTIWTATSRR